jgi:hypothetical protein
MKVKTLRSQWSLRETFFVSRKVRKVTQRFVYQVLCVLSGLCENLFLCLAKYAKTLFLNPLRSPRPLRETFFYGVATKSRMASAQI